MKKGFILFILMVAVGLFAMSQVPQTLTYQAVVRDGNGRLVCNSSVGVRISILQGSESGVAVYSDQQIVRTNANGLFTLLIGSEENSIGGIDWAAGPYFLKSEIDHTGGSNYTLATVQQLFSVPYALRAHTVDSIIGGVNYNETDPVFTAWDKDYNDLINRPTIPTMVSELTNDAGYLTFFTESQILSISNDTIFLTGGSFVKLPAGFSGDYNDLINRPNLADSVSRIVNEYHLGDTIINYISQNGYVDSSYVINYNTQQGYVDTSYVTNYINNGGAVTSETDPVFTAWDKDYNDLINKPNFADSVSLIVNEYHMGDTIINYISQNGYVDSSYVINYNTQQGYVDTSYVTNYINNGGAVTSESDPVFTAWDKDYNDLTNKPTIPTVPTNVSEFTNDAGYLTSYTETQTLANVAAQGNAVETQIKQLSDPTEELDAVNLRTLNIIVNTVVADWSHRFDSLAHRFDSIASSLDSIIAYQDSVIDTLSSLLTELSATTGDTTAVECERFNWYGTEYTVSGNYQHRLTNVAGFDSVLTLHLTINYGTHDAESQTACDSYTWHGIEYTVSGNYTYAYTNDAGCESVDTLKLTVGGFDSNGTSIATFSVAAGHTVRFSKGNLQYTTTGTHAVINGGEEVGTWRFAEHQYDFIGEDNSNIAQTYTGWIDLFGWGTSGWNGSGSSYYQPWDTTCIDAEGNYASSSYGPTGSYYISGDYASADWGVYNAISNGGNQPEVWRTLTKDEWWYLLITRTASTVNGTENARYAKAMVNGVKGLILFPDNFTMPSGMPLLTNINNSSASYDAYNCTVEQWRQMEYHGAVFLPAAGYRYGAIVRYSGSEGDYYSASCSGDTRAMTIGIKSDDAPIGLSSGSTPRTWGCSVRLVRDETTTKHGDTVVTTCESFMWYNNNYTSSGNYTHTFTTTSGEDSTVTLHLTIYHGYHNSENQTTCDSYTWRGNDYTASGTYTHDYTNGIGCASTDTLHLTINVSTAATDTHTECDSYTWIDGNDYTSSNNTATHTLTNVAGCDSVVTLNLTLNSSTHNADTQISAGSYIWHDTNYTKAGKYAFSYVNEVGCESTDTLYLVMGGFDGNGASNASFSGKIRFSRGNLQYQASTNTWRFAEHQYDIIGQANSNISCSYSGWIDLFAWGASQSSTYSEANRRACSCSNSETFYSYEGAGQNWGSCVVSNGGNQSGLWRCFADYNCNNRSTLYNILFTRTTSTVCGTENARFAKATVNGVGGLIILPDFFIMPTELTPLTEINVENAQYNSNIYTADQWLQLESYGAVFLPAAGRRSGTNYYGGAFYWFVSNCGSRPRYGDCFSFSSGITWPTSLRYYGQAVRMYMVVD